MGKPLISFDAIAENSPFFMDIDLNPDWETQFNNNHPFVLEIGFGTGNFLIELSAKEPNHNFIGMDFYHKGIRKIISRIEKLQIKNIRIVYGDARGKIPLIFDDEQLKGIYINFPDPWPKKRHIKRRLIKPLFVNALAKKLGRGGKIHIATDSSSYAEEIGNYFDAEPGLKNNISPFCYQVSRDDIPKTKYEKNFINAGKKIYYLEFTKAV